MGADEEVDEEAEVELEEDDDGEVGGDAVVARGW